MSVFSCICGKPALPGKMRCEEHQREWEEDFTWKQWEAEQNSLPAQSSASTEPIRQPMRNKRTKREGWGNGR